MTEQPVSCTFLVSLNCAHCNPRSTLQQSSTIPHKFQIPPNLQKQYYSQSWPKRQQHKTELDNALLTSLLSSPAEASGGKPTKYQVQVQERGTPRKCTVHTSLESKYLHVRYVWAGRQVPCIKVGGNPGPTDNRTVASRVLARKKTAWGPPALGPREIFCRRQHKK